MAFKFVQLGSGRPLPARHCVQWYSGKEGLYSFEGQYRIYRSVDGTVFAIASPNRQAFGYLIALFDAVTGERFAEPALPYSAVANLSLSSSDQVTVTFGETTSGPFLVPSP